jgi:hypothetical protein
MLKPVGLLACSFTLPTPVALGEVNENPHPVVGDFSVSGGDGLFTSQARHRAPQTRKPESLKKIPATYSHDRDLPKGQT